MALLISAVLFFLAFVLLLTTLARQHRRERVIALRLQGKQAEQAREDGWLQRLGSSALAQRSLSLDGETRMLLDRIGWRRSRQRSLYAALQVGVPLAAALAAVLVQQIAYPASHTPWLLPMFGQ